MTMREGDGTNASIASGVSVEKIEVESAPDGDDAPLSTSQEVLPISRGCHAKDIILVSTMPVHTD